jgi:hypothetical protein
VDLHGENRNSSEFQTVQNEVASLLEAESTIFTKAPTKNTASAERLAAQDRNHRLTSALRAESVQGVAPIRNP